MLFYLPQPAGQVAEDSTAAEHFERLARDINEAKARLDPIPSDVFSQVSRRLDLYFDLKNTLRSEGAQIVTNAWLKMFEMCGLFDLSRLARGGRLTAFCNAELPGAFIAAINHFCAGHRIALDWCGSSLFPSGGVANESEAFATEALGDRYGLFKHNRARWVMGDPGTSDPDGAPWTDGDVTVPATLRDQAGRVRRRLSGGADLYTADAGIDASSDYARQEENNLHVHFGQALAGLMTLREGGVIVLKQYSWHHPFTRGLIAELATHFDALVLCKPLTSRPANSEIYVVGTGFRGLDPTRREELLARLGERPLDLARPLCPVPADFEHALLRAATAVGRQQLQFLAEFAACVEKKRLDDRGFARAVAELARHRQSAWLELHPVPRLADAERLAVNPAAGKK